MNELLKRIWNRVHHKNRNFMAVFVGATGCHRVGQSILLFNGKTKKVEDIVVSDLLMGDDSSPRKVLELCRGNQQMVEIKPLRGGESFVVNLDHVLTLIRTNNRCGGSKKLNGKNGQIIDVKVSDYLKWSKTQKHLYKLFRVGVNFSSKQKLPIEPYFLGVLLGDGHMKQRISITSIDNEIIQEVYRQATLYGLKVRIDSSNSTRTPSYCLSIGNNGGKYRNPLVKILRDLELKETSAGTKFIPQNYKISNKKQRLELLAGLLDTDGSLNNGVFSFVSKSKLLAEDTAFVARSLGLSVKLSTCECKDQNGHGGTYYRLTISGNLKLIPCRVKRKQTKLRLQKKSVGRSGFKINFLGEEDYFGVIVNGNGRYLLGDFTVTHNSAKTYSAISMACLLDPNFNEDRIAFSSDEFMGLVKQDLPRGSAIVWDETGVGINARTFYDQANLAISYVTQTFRFKNYIVLFTVPSFTYVDKQVRQLFHARIKMKGFDQRKRVAFGEWRWLDYNSDTGKIYYKIPRLVFEHRTCKINLVYFPHPPEELTKTYEIRKKDAMVKLYEKYHTQVAYTKTPIAAIQKGFINIDKIVSELIKRKKEFKTKSTKRFNLTKICKEFGIQKDMADAAIIRVDSISTTDNIAKNKKFSYNV